MITTLLTVTSLLLLAAHGLRLGSAGCSLFWLVAAALAMSPLPWKSWALAGLLGFGTCLWVNITLGLVEHRLSLGLPCLRPAAILGLVVVLGLAAALLNCRRAWRSTSPGSQAQALAFLLTVAGLAVAREKTELDIILIDRFYPGGGWVAIILLGWYAAWIVAKLLQPGQSAKWRRIIWATFSLAFFLQLFLGIAGLERFLMTGSLHLPIPALIAAGPLYRADGFFMIILFAITLVLVGPAWCSYLCYFGVWDNLAAAAVQRPTPLWRWSRTVRWLICLLVLGVAVVLGRSGLPVLPAILLAAAFGLGGITVMLFWSRRQGTMVHCTSYCPMGLIADIFGKISPWRVRIGHECSKCNKCSRLCRYGALSLGDIDRGRVGLSCSLCGDCISGCPHGQLNYRFPGLDSTAARHAFVVVIVVLHSIFLGVARL